ncbi:MAG: diacylglycerol kinase family lipid kinase [Lachnospiraceae bacterium]|nr:diacylglycerol kinase family lipid kinase [Lachnospiraceae bacterium]
MIYFVVNPRSSTGKGLKKWKAIEERLKADGIEYDVHFTQGYLDARNYTRELVKGHEHITLAAVGGDGTVNEIVSGIEDFSRVTFGYIPTGSSNDLARSLNLKTDPVEALDAILHPIEYREIDIGRIEAENEVRNFAVSIGMNYDASVCHEVLHSTLKEKLNKLGLGKFTYLFIALKQLIRLRKCDCTMILDDIKKVSLKDLIFVTVMNHKYEGGGFMFCPRASDNDGYLDICSASGISKLKTLMLMPTAFKGHHVRAQGIEIKRAKKIELITSIPVAIHADGESVGVGSHAVVSVNEKKLKMVIR